MWSIFALAWTLPALVQNYISYIRKDIALMVRHESSQKDNFQHVPILPNSAASISLSEFTIFT